MKWKYALIAVMIPIVLLGSLSLIATFRPELVVGLINSNMSGLLGKMGIESDFHRLELEVFSNSLTVKTVSLKGEKCEFILDDETHLSVNKLDLSVQVDYLRWMNWIVVVLPSSAEGLNISVTSDSGENKAESKNSNLMKYIHGLKIANLRLKDSSFTLRENQKNKMITLTELEIVHLHSLALDFQGHYQDSEDDPIPFQAKLDGTLDLDRFEASKLRGVAQAKWRNGEFKMQLDNRDYKGHVEHLAKFFLTTSDLSGVYDAKININPSDYFIGLKSKTQFKGKYALELSNQSCVIGGNYSISDMSTTSVVQKCEFIVSQKINKSIKNIRIALPSRFSIGVQGEFQWDSRRSEKLRYLQTEVNLQSFSTRLYDIVGSLKVTKNDANADHASHLKVDSSLVFKIERLERLVESLRNTKLAVPAPFNTLRGPLECKLHGTIDVMDSTFTIPHSCSTNLSGEGQRITARERGVIRFDYRESKFDIDSDVELEDIALTMPDLALGADLPNLVKDSRFVGTEVFNETQNSADKSSDISLAFRMKIHTRNPTMVTLPSLATVVPLDMTLDVNGTDGVQGEIASRPFQLKLINKPIEIDRIKVTFKKESEPDLDALVKMKRSDIDLIVGLKGPFSGPVVSLTSDPIRSQQEIVSQLVYGDDFSGLGSDQQQAVGDTKAALAEGAVSIVSMLYLASTPVESVAFNPASKEFSAQFNIGGAGTLSVGKQVGGDSKISYSKRIKGNWYLQTEATESSENDSIAKGVAMMRWIRRF